MSPNTGSLPDVPLGLIRPADVTAIATTLKIVRHLSLRINDRGFEEARTAAAIAPHRHGLLRLLLLLLRH
jgi:hypothetical protein